MMLPKDQIKKKKKKKKKKAGTNFSCWVSPIYCLLAVNVIFIFFKLNFRDNISNILFRKTFSGWKLYRETGIDISVRAQVWNIKRSHCNQTKNYDFSKFWRIFKLKRTALCDSVMVWNRNEIYLDIRNLRGFFYYYYFLDKIHLIEHY